MTVNAQAVAQHINAELQGLATQRLAAGEALAAAGPADTFCSVWPQAKPILVFVAGIAALIPGLGATAAAVLNGLIKVGDATAAETCKP